MVGVDGLGVTAAGSLPNSSRAGVGLGVGSQLLIRTRGMAQQQNMSNKVTQPKVALPGKLASSSRLRQPMITVSMKKLIIFIIMLRGASDYAALGTSPLISVPGSCLCPDLRSV